jgi:3-oxoacyl-[acyl-carrier-protein] synthase II
MRRVVVTGIGLVTPLGCGNIEVWNKLISCHSGVTRLDLDIPGVSVSVAAKVQDFTVDAVFGKQSHKYKSTSTHYALHASDIALGSARFEDGKNIDLCRAGVAIASGMGTMKDITDTDRVCRSAASYRRLSPFFVSKILLNMAAGEVSIRHQLKGPNHCVATACAAGAHAIGDAYNFIRLGYADFMVAGGTEAPLDELSIAGFASMRALSKNSDPQQASRPFDSGRDGFVIGRTTVDNGHLVYK